MLVKYVSPISALLVTLCLSSVSLSVKEQAVGKQDPIEVSDEGEDDDDDDDDDDEEEEGGSNKEDQEEKLDTCKWRKFHQVLEDCVVCVCASFPSGTHESSPCAYHNVYGSPTPKTNNTKRSPLCLQQVCIHFIIKLVPHYVVVSVSA